MDIGKITLLGVTIAGGFFVGVLMGYAIKKVIKVAAVIFGLFFGGTNLSTVPADTEYKLGEGSISFTECSCYPC